MNKKILYLVIGVLCFFGYSLKVNAASIGISASSTSINPGGTITIKVNGSGVAGKFSVTSSDSNVLSGGTNSVWLEDSSDSYKFTAKSLGKATITLKALDVADKNGNSFSGSKSITINVVKPREKSKVDTLKGLSVEGYTLSPEFNKDIYEYNVEIGDNVDSIIINANKGDNYQNVEGVGTREVIEGDNKLEIVVTSETGSKKTYVINANVKDNNPINVDVDGKSYTVVKKIKALTSPEEFTETKVTINDLEIPAFTNEKLNITVVGLKDTEGKISLFIYDNGNYRKYDSIKSSSITVISKEPKEVPEGYSKKSITIDDQIINVYKNDNHTLIYGVNLLTNEEDWYQYDESEKTIQKYNYLEIQDLKKDYENKCNLYLYIAIGLGSLSVILLVSLLIVIIRKNKNSKSNDDINIDEDDIKEVKKEKIIEEPKKEIKQEKVVEKKELTKRRTKVEEVPYEKSNALKAIDEALDDEDEMSMEFLDRRSRSKRRKH